jgi:hypothetical protein
VGAAALAGAPEARADALAGAQFMVGQPTEAWLSFRASAAGSDWARRNHEAAMLEIQVDGKVVGDVVAAGGARPSTYRVALGHVAAGPHIVSIWLDAQRSAAKVRQAVAGKLLVTVDQPTDRVARYAPVLYGRDLADVPGRYENNHTDAPLLGFHTASTDRAGRTTIEYVAMWSGSDAETDPAALLARTGATADVEWVYRVTLDKRGRKLTEEYQGPDHKAVAFTGARERDHPLLRVATADNTVAPVAKAGATKRYRFPLDFSRRVPAGRPATALMGAWNYAAMAKELVREDKLETKASADTPALSDLRNYLFAELVKTTTAGPGVGVAVGVQLRGGSRWYTSDHGNAGWAITSDDPAATAVELPPGTKRSDIRAIRVSAVAADTAPEGYRVTVSALRGGFELSRSYVPGKPLARWTGKATLSAAAPTKVLWRAPSGS